MLVTLPVWLMAALPLVTTPPAGPANEGPAMKMPQAQRALPPGMMPSSSASSLFPSFSCRGCIFTRMVPSLTAHRSAAGAILSVVRVGRVLPHKGRKARGLRTTPARFSSKVAASFGFPRCSGPLPGSSRFRETAFLPGPTIPDGPEGSLHERDRTRSCVSFSRYTAHGVTCYQTF